MDKYHVVFHLDEENKLRGEMVLKNIANVLGDLGEKNVEVELVTNGKGVAALCKSAEENAEPVARLAAKGVRFVVCGHSLRQMGRTEQDLLDCVEIVPAGVGELVRKQAEGWAYIRP